MTHAYPLALSPEAALDPDAPAARTRADAEALAGGARVDRLATDWLSLSEEEIDRLLSKKPGAASGHLQRYEDAHGKSVLAITWWRLLPADTKPSKRKKAPAAPAPQPASTSDHTDDLYFRSGRTKTRRRPPANPDQLDLFGNKPGE